MTKYYIVAKEPNNNEYDLVKVNKGESLAEIDLYTSSFKDKEDFIKYLQDQGLNASSDADLFIAYQGQKNDIVHLDLVYGYYRLKEYAKKSLNGVTNTADCLKEVINEAHDNYEFRSLVRESFFKSYSALRTAILDSYHKKQLRLPFNAQWIRSDYRSGRDALAMIDEYYLIKDKLNAGEKDKLKEEKAKKELSRREIDGIIKMKINSGPEQISFIGEQRSYIKLLYINGKMFGNEDNKKVVREEKVGKITKPSDLSIETLDDLKIDYTKYQEIGDLLRTLKYKKLDTNKGERFEVDFSKEGFDLSDKDIKYLNGLLKTSIRKNSYYRQMYGSINRGESRREARRYSNSVYNTLKNSAKKKSDVYDKAYRFYMIYNELKKDRQIAFDDILTLDEENIHEGFRR